MDEGRAPGWEPRLVAGVIDPGRHDAEQERGEVDPELVKRDRVVVDGPDDGHMFHRDQEPADKNDFFRPRVAGHRLAHAHLRDERGVERIAIMGGEKPEEVGEHPEENIRAIGEKGKLAARGTNWTFGPWTTRG